ncbi:hypothetical protein [Ekhidna sp.]|uniref:hypothetical protein n=1 Tax=Ekhidna sp. TaxID=2608089 RepID=UPI003BA95F8C
MKRIFKMNNLGLLAMLFILFTACQESLEMLPEITSPESGGWGGLPTGVITVEELTNAQGFTYFEDIRGNKFALHEGNFVCSNDFPEAMFSKVEVSNLHEYQGFVEDGNGAKIFITQGIAFRPATESEIDLYAAGDMDCSLLISNRRRPCVDDEGRDGYEECTTIVFVCISHAFGLQVDITEDCFGCGGEIGGIGDEPEIEPLCF